MEMWVIWWRNFVYDDVTSFVIVYSKISIYITILFIYVDPVNRVEKLFTQKYNENIKNSF